MKSISRLFYIMSYYQGDLLALTASSEGISIVAGCGYGA
jgi:hypothetical protein